MSIGLPLFVYGSLKPDEIAYNLISKEVREYSPATLEGAVICIRDGFPFVNIDSERWGSANRVSGYLLFANEESQQKMLEIALIYENPEFYELIDTDVQVAGQSVRAQVFSGKVPERADVETLKEPWRAADNPLFAHAFAQVGIGLEELLKSFKPNEEIFPKEYWPQMIKAEGLFLVLSSILEHLIALKFGYGKDLNPESRPSHPRIEQYSIQGRLKAFSNEPDWQKAFGQVEIPKITVFDIWQRNTTFNSSDQTQALKAWYAVRSNLGHRGKSSRQDAVKVLKALVGLYSAMRAYLLIALPDVESRWEVMGPNGAPICLYKGD